MLSWIPCLIKMCNIMLSFPSCCLTLDHKSGNATQYRYLDWINQISKMNSDSSLSYADKRLPCKLLQNKHEFEMLYVSRGIRLVTLLINFNLVEQQMPAAWTGRQSFPFKLDTELMHFHWHALFHLSNN